MARRNAKRAANQRLRSLEDQTAAMQLATKKDFEGRLFEKKQELADWRLRYTVLRVQLEESESALTEARAEIGRLREARDKNAALADRWRDAHERAVADAKSLRGLLDRTLAWWDRLPPDGKLDHHDEILATVRDMRATLKP